MRSARFDSAEWLSLSWRAQSLFCLLLHKVADDGRMSLGKYGKRGVALHVGGMTAWTEVEPILDELLGEGLVTIAEGFMTIADRDDWIGVESRKVDSEARRRAGRLGGIASGEARRSKSSSKPRPASSNEARASAASFASDSASLAASNSAHSHTCAPAGASDPDLRDQNTHTTHTAQAGGRDRPSNPPTLRGAGMGTAPGPSTAALDREADKGAAQPSEPIPDVDSHGGVVSAAEQAIIKHLRGCPVPVRYLAKVTYAQQFACAQMSGASVGDICEAITGAALKIGDHRDANPDDLASMNRLANYVATFVQNQRRHKHNGPSKAAVTTAYDPRIAQTRDMFGKAWSRAMGAVYGAPEADLEHAAAVLAEAERTRDRIIADGVRPHALSVYVKHWIDCYFADDDEWIAKRRYPLALLLKRSATYGVPHDRSEFPEHAGPDATIMHDPLPASPKTPSGVGAPQQPQPSAPAKAAQRRRPPNPMGDKLFGEGWRDRRANEDQAKQ